MNVQHGTVFVRWQSEGQLMDVGAITSLFNHMSRCPRELTGSSLFKENPDIQGKQLNLEPDRVWKLARSTIWSHNDLTI